jgi:hypothetical protein
LKKLVLDNQKSWHKKIHDALWTNKTTPKRAICISPFELFYRVEANFPLPLELVACKLNTMIEEDVFKDGLEKRIMNITKLQEERDEMVDKITEHQGRINKLFDRRERPTKFMEGDLVLL